MPIAEYTGTVPNRFTQPNDVFEAAIDTFVPYFTSIAPQINAQIAALNALTTGTSTTSNIVGTGAKTFTTQLNLGFQVGQALTIASIVSALNQMTGICTAYNASTGALSVTSQSFSGSGTLTSWQIGLAPVGSILTAANDSPDVINGQFRIAQNGTSFASPATGAYDLDGWLFNNTSTAVVTIAQVSSSVNVGKFARRVTVNTADAAVAIGESVAQVTRLRGYDIVKYIGNTFTVNFKAKVPVAGIHCVALKNSGNDRSYVAEINFPTANVLQDCSFTVTGGLITTGTWNYTTGIGLSIAFCNLAGSTFQTTANTWATGNFFATANQVNDTATVGNVFELENVRINLGTIAGNNESSFDDDFRQAQKYYNQTVVATGTLYATTGSVVYSSFAAMNSTPTIIFQSANVDGIGAPAGLTLVDSTGSSTSLIRINYTFTAIGAVGNTLRVYCSLSARL